MCFFVTPPAIQWLENTCPFWGIAYFQGRLLLVSGRVPFSFSGTGEGLGEDSKIDHCGKSSELEAASSLA